MSRQPKTSNESGQAATEYVLLLLVVIVASGLFARGFLSTIDSGIAYMGGALEKQLKTGRLSATIWSN